MIVDPLLGVTDNQKGSAGLANLHGLLLHVVLVLVSVCRQDGPSEVVSLFSQLVAELHQTLCLFDVTLNSCLLGFTDQSGNLFAEQNHLFIGFDVLTSTDSGASCIEHSFFILLSQQETFLGPFDPVLEIGQHALTEAKEIIEILTLLVRVLVFVKLFTHVFVVNVAARAQVCFSVCKKVVWAKLNYEIPANVWVRPLQFSSVGVAFEEVAVAAHQLVQHRGNL
jgi:hypothetical protein